jgi:hypothetical protein
MGCAEVIVDTDLQDPNIMTIEQDSNEVETYQTYNPYLLDNIFKNEVEPEPAPSTPVSSRKLGSLAQRSRGFGRLDSVNDHHKTTLGGVKKV